MKQVHLCATFTKMQALGLLSFPKPNVMNIKGEIEKSKKKKDVGHTILHINNLNKQKTHMIISIAIEKAFDKPNMHL